MKIPECQLVSISRSMKPMSAMAELANMTSWKTGSQRIISHKIGIARRKRHRGKVLIMSCSLSPVPVPDGSLIIRFRSKLKLADGSLHLIASYESQNTSCSAILFGSRKIDWTLYFRCQHQNLAQALTKMRLQTSRLPVELCAYLCW